MHVQRCCSPIAAACGLSSIAVLLPLLCAAPRTVLCSHRVSLTHTCVHVHVQAPKLAISPDERVQIPVLSDLNANK